MDKRTRIIGIAAAVTASIIILVSPSNSIIISPPTTRTTGTNAVQIVATNLQKPWAMSFGDNKTFFTEKVGKIRVIDNGTLVNESVADLRVADVTDTGLLRHSLYQLPVQNDVILEQKIILDGVGRIRDVSEGPDGYLYILTSNIDGMGFPDQNDDKLLRIVK
ncbi:MAG: PQQ-dependent sugar dehydrogenase [Nitrosotalea sp.]